MREQATIDVGYPTPAVRMAIDFARNRDTILVLSGSVGCGKTAAALVAEKLHRSQGAQYHSGQLSAWSPWDDEWARAIGCPGVLVLDDVGSQLAAHRDDFTERLERIVTPRHEAGRKCAITTNIPFQDGSGNHTLYAALGERVTSRLRGSGSGLQVMGPDLRQPAGQAWLRERYPSGPHTELRYPDLVDPEPADPAEMIPLLEECLARMRKSVAGRVNAFAEPDENELLAEHERKLTLMKGGRE